MNAHDVEAFVACFAEDYEQRAARASRPGVSRARPGARELVGGLRGVPDFRAEVVRVAAVGDTAWSEWRWQGTQAPTAGGWTWRG